MVLSDKSIKQAIDQEKLIIKPFNKDCLQPASLDFHLGDNFLIFKNTRKGFLDSRKDNPADFTEKVILANNEPIVVHPNEFILGTTREWIKTPPDLVARLEGKSSLGRLGILIHATAGYVDPGFEGELTLEIFSVANIPIALYAGMKICQISFFQMTTPAQVPYGTPRADSHYQGQTGATASQIHRLSISS